MITPNKVITLGQTPVNPPLFLAPMAGVTHSAFRRLLADYGGYGALFTEMLSSKALRAENVHVSPFTKKRESEKAVIYQLVITPEDPFEVVINQIIKCKPSGLDINCGCPAPEIKKRGAGSVLFEDEQKLCEVLSRIRKLWSGSLSVKCRLGSLHNGWETPFKKRLKILEDCGVDWITVHPRFTDEKLKRSARWHYLKEITSWTRLPVVGNGDILSHADVSTVLQNGCAGAMLGRITAIKPWIFSEIASGNKMNVDYKEIWERMFNYIGEDFGPEKTMGRIKEFTSYFSRNFTYGHQFFLSVNNAQDIETLKRNALAFLGNSPALLQQPSVFGI